MRDVDGVQVHATDKPTIYTASGEPVILKRPLGFAANPAASNVLQPKPKEKS